MTATPPTPWAELADALTNEFSPTSFDAFMASQLDIRLDTIVSRNLNHRARVHEVLSWAESTGQIERLVRAAFAQRPKSALLREVSMALGFIRETPDSHGEPISSIVPPDRYEDWLRQRLEVQQQMCWVAAPASDVITGFLVGPDQVMMCSRPSDSAADRYVVVFPDGSPVGMWGNELVWAWSEAGRPVVAVWKLVRTVGREGGRGWITPSAEVRGVFAVPHYMNARELVVSFDARDRDRVPDSDGLLRYHITPQPGRLGAPCFDERWNFAGVHIGTEGTANVAVSGAAILEMLADSGFEWDPVAGVRRAAPGVMEGAWDSVVRLFADPDTEEDHDPEWWAFVEAAAVTATYDPEQLAKIASPETAAAVLRESMSLQRDGTTRWMLGDDLRKQALKRLAARGQLKANRAAAKATGEPVDTVFAAFIAGVQPAPADLQYPDRLRTMVQAAEWLEGTGIATPKVEDLRAALERAVLLSPFRHLTRGFFAGRQTELDQLKQYVDGPGGSPTLIHGPGGMGKSALLAHFILTNAERDATRPETWRPFVYLDFDRPDLDARDRVGTLLAIARQLGPQVPAIKSRAEQLVRTELARRRAERGRSSVRMTEQPQSTSPRSTGEQLQAHCEAVAELLRVVPGPLVVVLDTLEEVKHATPDALAPLVAIIDELARLVPGLRPILAGRTEIEGVELAEMPLGPLSLDAAEALLVSHLLPEVATRTDSIRKLVGVVGGNPLSLLLAAQLLVAEATKDAAQLREEAMWRRIGDEAVQGQLYERIARHLHDDRIQRLAIPGLVLRYVTADLIAKVLAEPCGVDPAEASELFDGLAREIALVFKATEHRLVVLPHLRRKVIDGLRHDAKTAGQRRKIHANAVVYFAGKAGAENRAEEIYHRLWLDESPEEIDRRWMPGIEQSLRSAIEELDGPARSHLIHRLGGTDDETSALALSPAEWEAYAEKRSLDLLELGAPDKVLRLLRLRSGRLPSSKLYRLESVALRTVAAPDLEAAERAAECAVTAAKAAADPSQRELALQELLDVKRALGDTAGTLRALADLGDLGEQLGDDLVLLQSQVESLEAYMPGAGAAELSGRAVRVFARLPSSLVARAPDLARRVAAQVGETSPTVLQRMVELVGLGAFDDDQAKSLAGILGQWASRDPSVAPFVPKPPVSREALASAMQYLLPNRAIDGATATAVARWLRGIVTPTTSREVDRERNEPRI